MTVNAELEYKHYYQEELYMVADVATGVLYNRSGRRMLALTDDFLIGLHRALEKECGDRAAAVIHACGRRWGHNFGEGLAAEWAEFYKLPFREFPMALFECLLMQEFAHNGWGTLQIDYSHFDKGIIALSLQGAIMAAIRKDLAGSRQADVLTAGILGGMFSVFLGRELDCIQSQSESEGLKDSRFLLSSGPRIGQLREGCDDTDHHTELLARLLELAETVGRAANE